MTNSAIAIIGAGPYGLSLAAHLAARNIEHRIFGHPMQFWSRIAEAGGERYLKSFCFGTNISTPINGSSFADYSEPRGLETFEPCSMGHFADYGHWFQERNVPWVESVDVSRVERQADGFAVTLADGERMQAGHVVIATGLAYLDHIPRVLAALPPGLATHTAKITRFADFKGRNVAVVGAGQSALEAAALLHEVGARPELIVREDSILWMSRLSHARSLWQRLRWPASGLGVGVKAWGLTHFPGAMHHAPSKWRTRFVKSHLPAEGAWWLRERVETRVPIHFKTTVVDAKESDGLVALRLQNADGERALVVDHVVAGTGYVVDVDRIEFFDQKLRRDIRRIESAPKLNASFEASASGLYFIGPASAISFGPLFRFVVGAEYSARVVAAHLATQVSSAQGEAIVSGPSLLPGAVGGTQL